MGGELGVEANKQLGGVFTPGERQPQDQGRQHEGLFQAAITGDKGRMHFKALAKACTRVGGDRVGDLAGDVETVDFIADWFAQRFQQAVGNGCREAQAYPAIEGAFHLDEAAVFEELGQLELDCGSAEYRRGTGDGGKTMGDQFHEHCEIGRCENWRSFHGRGAESV